MIDKIIPYSEIIVNIFYTKGSFTKNEIYNSTAPKGSGVYLRTVDIYSFTFPCYSSVSIRQQ